MTVPIFLAWIFKRKTSVASAVNDISIYLPQPPDDTIAFFTNSYAPVAGKAAEAAYIIHPQLLRDPAPIAAELQELEKKYRPFQKPVIVFILSDFEGNYRYYSNLILLRTSARRSQMADNEFSLPYVWESANEPFVATANSTLPLIGFCGLVSANRKALINAFESDSRFNCSFIKRNAFWGGKPHDENLMNAFWENMRQSEFMLADRGAGNFSMRFYQALSMGRIPVLLDTDLPLPFPELINWQQCILKGKNTDECLEKVFEIHASGKTTEWQKRCYDIYQQYLSEKVFLSQLIPEITKGRLV